MGQNCHALILWNTRNYLPHKKLCLSSVAFLGGLENMVAYERNLIYEIEKLQIKIA